MKRYTTILIAMSILVLAQLGLAQVPATISYQGVLRYAGDIVTDGDYTLRFKLFDVATLGSALGTPAEWSEDHTTTVTDGLFSVVLGSISPFGDAAIHFTAPYWLEIDIVEGATVTTLSPRIELTAAPYAVKSGGVRGSNITFHPGSGGSLGIGTTTPEANLQVLGNWRLGPLASGTLPTGADNWLNANNGILYEAGGNDWAHHFSAYGAGDIARFGTSAGVGQAPDTRVVITNSGDVGIGTTAPAYKLDVSGDARTTGDIYLMGQDLVFTGAAGSYTSDDSWLRRNPSFGFIEIKPNNATYGLYLRALSGNDYANFETQSGYLTMGYNTGDGPLYITNADVGIGTATPSVALEVVGTVKADSIQLATPAERWYAIPPSSFTPKDNSVLYYLGTDNVYATTWDTLVTTVELYAPVHLPHGATITEFHPVVYDNDGTYNIDLRLRELDDSGNISLIATKVSSGATTTYDRYSEIGLSYPVDNQNYAYYVYAFWNASNNSANIKIGKVYIAYTVTNPLP